MEMKNSVFLEQRAIALATVLLTRHPDVVVMPTSASHDRGYDLEVNLTREGRVTGRVFGVELKARTSLQGIGSLIDGNRVRLRSELGKSMERSARLMRDLPFPLLFIVFAMNTDRAFFGWMREPAAQRRLMTPRIEFAEEWVSDTHVRVMNAIGTWYTQFGFEALK